MAQNESYREDPDHDLVEHLISYKKLDPGSETAAVCEEFRELFKEIGHKLVREAKRTPDRTVAIREIHRACMTAIAALVLNAD